MNSGVTTVPILTLNIRYEHDTVSARQRARQIARLLGFDAQDQTRIATAVSEIARNAFRYAGGGKIEYAHARARPRPEAIDDSRHGQRPGIQDLDGIMRRPLRSPDRHGYGYPGRPPADGRIRN